MRRSGFAPDSRESLNSYADSRSHPQVAALYVLGAGEVGGRAGPGHAALLDDVVPVGDAGQGS